MMPLQVKIARGFTLIELIAVVLLLSVLGVVAMGRLGNLGGFEQKALFDEVVAAVQHAQKLAVSTGCPVKVSLRLPNALYRLTQGAAGCEDGNYATGYTRNVLRPSNRAEAYTNSPGPFTPTAAFLFTSDSRVIGESGSQLGNQTFTISARDFTVYGLTGLVDAL